MRLQVFISHSGYCSRRKALELVKQGFVRVNGQAETEPSYDVDENKDKVIIEGKKIELKPLVYLLLNKPVGYTTTLSDRHAEHTVMELLPEKYQHLYPVGRLDKDSEGLLLFTNDGELANRLMHPKFKVEKVYEVEVDGRVTRGHLQQLARGVWLDGKKTAPAKVQFLEQNGAHSKISMAIREGRKRQIRRMFDKIGYKVFRLKRVSYGPLQLASFAPGNWRELNANELLKLQSVCGL